MTMEKQTPAIDFDHLKQYLGDDIALTQEVFGLFKHQVDMWQAGLDPLAEDENWTAVMHTLKGSARAVGALDLATVCEKGEGLVAKDGAVKGSTLLRERLLADLEFEIERAKIDIGRWEYRQTLAEMRK